MFFFLNARRASIVTLVDKICRSEYLKSDYADAMPSLNMKVRTVNFRAYFFRMRDESKTFDAFWKRIRPRRKVSKERLQQLRDRAQRIYDGEMS